MNENSIQDVSTNIQNINYTPDLSNVDISFQLTQQSGIPHNINITSTGISYNDVSNVDTSNNEQTEVIDDLDNSNDNEQNNSVQLSSLDVFLQQIQETLHVNVQNIPRTTANIENDTPGFRIVYNPGRILNNMTNLNINSVLPYNYREYQQSELNEREYEEFINGTFDNDKSDMKKITSEKGLCQIKSGTYQKTMEYDSCPITTDGFKEGDSISILPCDHYFSPGAIKCWLKESNKCPMCRYELDFEEVKIEEDETNDDEPYQQNSDIETRYEIHHEGETPTESEYSEDEEESDIENNEVNHPFGALHNRDIIPHSYIRTIIDNQIILGEEEIMQEAIMMSLMDSQQDKNNES
jgi:hypothetical protein